jgi:hypothetical protein
MTILTFFIGMALMALGFTIIWRTNYFLQWFGDIGQAFGTVGMPWLSWKAFGLALLFGGFLVAFGLFEILLGLTIGRLFTIGEF